MNLGLRPAVSPEPLVDAGMSLATSVLPCLTASVRASRSPAVFRAGRPLMVFIPDLLTDLPSACRSALPLSAIFDVTVCELPGHGGSGGIEDVSIPGFAQEFAALVDDHVPRDRCVTLAGMGVGGLIALETARLRPERVARAILLDAPFTLTRPAAAAAMAARLRRAPSAFGSRVLTETLAIDPDSGRPLGRIRMHDMVEDIDFPCAILAGGDQGPDGEPSVLSDGDLEGLHAANGALLIPGRVDGAGHRLLDDDPAACMATLDRLLRAG